MVRCLHQQSGMSTATFFFLLAAAVPFAEPVAVVQGPRGTVTASLFSEENAGLPVASVEGQAVTLEEFSQALAAAHGAHGTEEKAGKTDFRPVLDRLIGGRLIALEAHEMGLDDLPELKKAVDDFAALELRRAMLRKLLEGATPDAGQAERYFRDAVREWKIDSLLFAREAQARDFSRALKEGQDFGRLASQAVAAKEAARSAGGFVAASKMLPQVAAAAHGLFAGQVSDPVQVQDGWAVFRVGEIRYPEDAAAREEAGERAASEAREAAMKVIYPKLLARRARIDRKLLARLDFEARKPGFAALQKDDRVLVKIAGGKEIRVKDLAREIAKGFFHGIDDAVRQKRVNEQKDRVFENLLRGEVLAAEAAAQKIDSTPAWRRAVAEKREALVFGEFVRRVILPGIDVKEEEGRAYYQAHAADFTLPAFYTLDSISFSTAKAAQAAAARLRSGTDFRWLGANADGRAKEDLALNGSTVSAAAIPDGLRAQMTAASVSDVKVFESEGLHHVAVIRRIVPGTVQPYLEVRAEIAKKLTGEKVNRALAEWVEKLRKAHDVRIYLQRIGT